MNRCVVVTGAGRGLGFQLASRHLEEKDRVYAYDRELTGELMQMAADNPLLLVRQCDIASTESVANATAGLLAAEDRVDILYNNAAIYRFEDRVGLAETDLDGMAEMFNVNSVGMLRVCKALWNKLQKGSLIMNISSEAGSVSACRRDTLYSYCMSKSAMNMGAKILSNELWPVGVRVMNLHPGWLKTFMGGEEALLSKAAISPGEAAGDIVNIALTISQIPRDILYMQHSGEIMSW